MPQIAKGGKWVFGWSVIDADGMITIPPEAWHEYGYSLGEEIVFIPGSHRSGGFGLSTARLLEKTSMQNMSAVQEALENTINGYLAITGD